MPRASVGELVLLEQDDVLRAGLRQVVRHRATDDATADHHDRSFRRYVGGARQRRTQLGWDARRRQRRVCRRVCTTKRGRRVKGTTNDTDRPRHSRMADTNRRPNAEYAGAAHHRGELVEGDDARPDSCEIQVAGRGVAAAGNSDKRRRTTTHQRRRARGEAPTVTRGPNELECARRWRPNEWTRDFRNG